MKKSIHIFAAFLVALSLFGCTPNSTGTEETVKTEASTTEQVSTADTQATAETSETAPEEPKSVGFVMVGLGNEFFEGLKTSFEKKFTDLGWEVDVANGEFNPQTQITAVENFIAMKKDVIIIWAVSPEPLNSVTSQAMDAGIKVISFVQPLVKYDACLIADNEKLAAGEAKLATKWVDETFPDAADGSIPCAVITRDNVDSTKMQGDVLKKMAEFNPKIKVVSVYDNDDESVEGGMNAAENIYTKNPEVKLFLTVNSASALGINNYFTGMSSPVTDYSQMGVFTINGGTEITEQIDLSRQGEAPLRGTVMTGGVDLTVDDMIEVADGVMEGKYANNYNKYALNLFVYDKTLDEFNETGNVVSVTEADFE